MSFINNLFKEWIPRKEMILTRGIPASGKSTWAEKYVADNGGFIISKDQIRKEMGLTKDNWSKVIEKSVITAERMAVTEAIKFKTKTIVIDNTHLGEHNPHILFYKELAEANSYDFIIKDFYVSREEAIRRDEARPSDKKVGVEVIDRFIKQQGNGGYPKNPEFKVSLSSTKPNSYIVDIDGTLAFMDGKRSPYDYSKVSGDRVNVFLREILYTLSKDNNIYIVSGRDDDCAEQTIFWLRANNIPYDHLYMRVTGDTRKDSIVKKEIYENLISPNANVIGVFDDRAQVIDTWRLDLGLPTYQVWYGNF